MAELACSYTILPSNDSTVAVDVSRLSFGRSRCKDTFYFEAFQGEMTFTPDDLAAFKMQLRIDARGVACFRAGLSEKKRLKTADLARKALTAAGRNEIQFTAKSISAKPLRGYLIECVLHVCGISRVVKVNAVFSPVRNGAWQLDCDATIRLSEFDLPCPSSLFGLLSTRDESSVRLLLWAAPLAQSEHATA